MNRSVASLLFLATAVFFAGCSNHPDSFGESGSTGSTGMGGSEVDDGVEPRSVTISGVGPRWEGVSWDAPRD